MRQAGVTEAPARERRSRALVDFGVDETWEPARPTRTRRERQVESWVDDGDLFAPRYEDDLEPAPARPVRLGAPSDGTRAPDGARASDVASVSRAAAGPRARADVIRRAPEAPRRRPDTSLRGLPDAPLSRLPDTPDAAMVVQTDAGPVSVDILAHPAHVPSHDPIDDRLDEAPARSRPVSDSAAAEPHNGPTVAGAGVAGRRTVTIRGRGAERDLAFPEPGRARRPPVRRHERPGFKPDRTALWALLLGVVLVLVAATSSHAAALSHSRPSARSAALLAPAPAAARVLTVTVRR